MLNIFKRKHPPGLYLLFCVEMWERFSYYGMRALLILYMTQTLMFSIEKSGNIYGFYTGLVYLTPLIGGYIADKYLGQRKCITAGAIFMTVGLFVLAFAPKNLFLFSLFLMIVANGCFKSNISSVLGLLYENKNEYKDSAYTIFYMGINLGAFLSPILCGTIAIKYGYEYGFAIAGIGMFIGLILYKAFEHRYLGEVGTKPIIKQITIPSYEEKLTLKQKEQYTYLFFLMLFTIPFWICFEQAGSSLTLFAEFNVNRIIEGKEIATGYFQSLNPLFIILFAPLVSFIWEELRKYSKEPSSIEKFAISLFLMFISYIILTFVGHLSEYGKISLWWLVLVYFIMTLSELCISPIGLSLVSKLTPKKFLSMTMSCWFLTSFFGNIIAGFWGGKYEVLTPFKLFLSLSILSFITFLIIVCFIPKINKILIEDN